MPANPTDGAALLAGATAEDLERDARWVEGLLVTVSATLGEAGPNTRTALLRLAALARAVAKMERKTNPERETPTAMQALASLLAPEDRNA